MNDEQLDPKLLAAIEVMESIGKRFMESFIKTGCGASHRIHITVNEYVILEHYFRELYGYELVPAEKAK